MTGESLPPPHPREEQVESLPPPPPPEEQTRELPIHRTSSAVRATPVEHIRCPRCGTANDPARFLCERCGAELETGRLATSRWAVHHVPVGGRRRTPLALRIAEVVLVIAALAGAGLVLASQLGVGPFEAARPADRPSFDPERYRGEPARLPVSSVALRDPRSGEERGQRPLQVVDGDPTTAWRAGERDRGLLTLRLARAAWVSRLVIRNGDQQDGRAFRAAARAKRALLRLGTGAVYEVSLKDQLGEQIVALPEPVLTASVALEFRDVYPGKGEAALAVSEMAVLGWVPREPPAG